MAWKQPLGVRWRSLWAASISLILRQVGDGCAEVSDESAEWFLSLVHVFSVHVLSRFLHFISSQCIKRHFYTCELVNSIVTEYCNILARECFVMRSMHKHTMQEEL